MVTTIFENANIRASESAEADAILVTDGRIALIGTVADCRAAARGPHERVDLDGGWVMSAFIDSHVHTVQKATRSLALDVSFADGFEQLALVAGAAVTTPGAGRTASGWLLASGWNAGGWRDRRPPNLAMLDRATGPHPVALHSADLHSYWLNTAAMSRLALDPLTALDGIVAEASAFAVQHEIERSICGTLEARIAEVLQSFLAVGVAGIHDIDDRIAREAFRRLAAEHALPLRVHKLTIDVEREEVADAGIHTGSGDEWLDYGGIKLFSDGALGSHTSFLTEPFADRNSRGIEAISAPELMRTIRACTEDGFTVAIHAIGDGAVHNVVEALLAEGRGPIPHRIEHMQHIRPDDLDRIARTGAIAVMQPASCTSDIDIVERRLGRRDVVSYGWRSLRERGVQVAFSSDAPVEAIDPLAGIYAAVTRQRPDGTPAGGWQPHERLTRAEAWYAYTAASAQAAGHTDRGRLARGMLADLVVLDRDPRTVDDAGLRDALVRRTIVGGVTRWTATEHDATPHPIREETVR